MPRLAKWTLQSIIICTLFSVAILSGCSEQFSDETALKDFERLGGTELILEVDMVHAVDQELDYLKDKVRQAFREENSFRTGVIRIEGDEILIRLRDSEDMSRAMDVLNSLHSELKTAQSFSGETLNITVIGERQFRLVHTEDYTNHLKKRLTEQSMNVIRRRNENIDRPRLSVKPLENGQFRLLIPTSSKEENVKQIFRRQGNLSFHMVRAESNNVAAMDLAEKRGIVPPGAIYYPQEQGGGLIVERRTKITGECLKTSSEGLHPAGNYPIVNFSFNVKCAKLFGRLTKENVGKRFAVVVDDVIITAPRINGAITGGSGFIEGNFLLESAKELARLLNSGPLPANLKIIKESTIKPKT